ncbi:APH(3') family aminoglycoside O-phosphotransferase [Lederbergia galactosidilytica]|uniref:Aminoglycoside phosphotransferase domain-containing protein n=1 Tax=Lederbergia galactosidilytica TaxID=217031 RepID=A0A177ZKY0_9BACI|nr:APH(3') family aminoglycoside O-phosphotransferase [Lederbergia galactosidilytica]KRG14495.1 hypothetical protein ACA30_11015 [Virgibacillus soli]OAK68243.1 hypothetical protein ABB05_16965 [Lederbergia galactosidilytica]
MIINRIPTRLEKMIDGYTWTQVTIGHSEASTFLLKKGNHHLYLKIQAISAIETLRQEKEKMEWLHGKLSVPGVLCYERNEEKEFLLMTEITGMDASNPFNHADLTQLIKLLAKGLREIHSISIDRCPFQRNLDMTIREAQERVEKNLVDREDFDEERKGKDAEELYQELLEKHPLDEELVFTHGDYCLPNIILHNKSINGFIDLGRAGIADRYQDIALAVRSITYNVGEQHIPLFLTEYGLKELNQNKLRYYQLLDEFF